MKVAAMVFLAGLLVVAFLAITAMVIAMAPYVALLFIIGILCWLSSKVPDPEEKGKQAPPPRWPDDSR